jgi:hypothetical protein
MSKIVGVAGATTVEVEDGIPDTALYAPADATLKVAEYVPVTPATRLQEYVATFADC